MSVFRAKKLLTNDIAGNGKRVGLDRIDSID